MVNPFYWCKRSNPGPAAIDYPFLDSNIFLASSRLDGYLLVIFNFYFDGSFRSDESAGNRGVQGARGHHGQRLHHRRVRGGQAEVLTQ